MLIAEGIAPANLYKRKLEDDDPEVDDQARWEAIQVSFLDSYLRLCNWPIHLKLKNSIVLLDKKFAKKGVVPFNTTVDNSMTEDNPEYDSDLEHDEARLYSLRVRRTVACFELWLIILLECCEWAAQEDIGGGTRSRQEDEASPWFQDQLLISME